jgi:hypothetical protein
MRSRQKRSQGQPETSDPSICRRIEPTGVFVAGGEQGRIDIGTIADHKHESVAAVPIIHLTAPQAKIAWNTRAPRAERVQRLSLEEAALFDLKRASEQEQRRDEALRSMLAEQEARLLEKLEEHIIAKSRPRSRGPVSEQNVQRVEARPRFTDPAARQWMRDRAATWPDELPAPTEEEDLAAADAHFAPGWARDELRLIRLQETPEAWRKKGPRRPWGRVKPDSAK